MKSGRQLLLLNAIVSGFLGILFLVAFLWTNSSAALAQGSDSVGDALLGALLVASVAYASFAADKNAMSWADGAEPATRLATARGEARAERLERGASAVVGGAIVVVAAKIFYQSLEALLTKQAVTFEVSLLGFFIAKIAFKWLLLRKARNFDRPALRALCVDAQSDVIVGVLASLSYLSTLREFVLFDSIVGLAAALWILKNGIELVIENLASGSKSSEFRVDLPVRE